MPEPVVPATRRCGPSVCRSSMRTPSSPRPMGTASPGRALFADHLREVSGAERGSSSASGQDVGMVAAALPGWLASRARRRQNRLKTSLGARSGANRILSSPALNIDERSPSSTLADVCMALPSRTWMTCHPCSAAVAVILAAASMPSRRMSRPCPWEGPKPRSSWVLTGPEFVESVTPSR